MRGLTMAVPRGLGLVAALAVSGTALYFVYGYKKKKAFVNIWKGEGLLKLEFGYPNVIRQQTQTQNQRQSSRLLKEATGGGLCLELREGRQAGLVEIYYHQLPCLRRASTPHEQADALMPRPPLLLLTTNATRANENMQDRGLRERLVECEANVALVKALHTTLSTYTVGTSSSPVQQRGDCSGAEGCVGGALEEKSFEMPALLDNVSRESEPLADGRTLSDVSARDSLLLVSSSNSSLSPAEDCRSRPTLSTASSSSTTSSSSARSFAVVGSFISSGKANGAGKPKKVVRFSPSVAEPSSNNQDYRRRFKAQMAQRPPPALQRKTPDHAPESAIRSIAYSRPRLYSQAAQQTITYNLRRADNYRYGGRAY